jgi:hypothetical protein
MLVIIEIKNIVATYMIIPSDPEFVPSHPELVPSHPESVPSDKEFVPSDKEFDSGISILSLQALIIILINRKIGMIYRNTGQYSPAKVVLNVFSTVHKSKHKFHYKFIPSINACQFHKYGIGIC